MTRKRNNYGLKGAHIIWKAVPKKGRGVFTTRNIKKGEIIEVSPVVTMKSKNVPKDEAPDGTCKKCPLLRAGIFLFPSLRGGF
jgi:SET domain-containing protein